MKTSSSKTLLIAMVLGGLLLPLSAQSASGDPKPTVADAKPATTDTLRQLEDEFDQEVLAEAVARVRTRVIPKTWQAFELTAYDGRSGADVAETLGMSPVWAPANPPAEAQNPHRQAISNRSPL